MIVNKMDELCSDTKASHTRRMKKMLQTQAESMLGQLKICTDPKQKLELIKSHNPTHYFFGFKLDPRNPYEKENEDESNTSKTNPTDLQGQGENHATV